jgi:hypothetical protein
MFAALSLSLHAFVFAWIGRATTSASPRLAFEHTSQPLTGDTLDVEPPSAPALDDSDSESATAPSSATSPATATATRVRLSVSGISRPPSASSSAAEPAPVPPRFGAVGARYATDVATTFTRAFPQAGSAEPTWYAAPFGSAGRAEVTLVLSDDGALLSTEVGGSPSPALRRSIDRTLLLLAPRTFTARGAVTRLHIAAHVSRDAVHDGLHGDVFALSAGSFSGEVGTAFFALPPGAGPGRRVDVEVKLLP